jgi:hypothetical protein
MNSTHGIDRATHMLLASDGSTTLLLEALLHRPLSVRVDYQGAISAGDLTPNVVAALRLTPEDFVLERKSRLLTSEGTVISINMVVFCPKQPVGHSAAPNDPVPLGKKLRNSRTRQHREILSSGTAEWPGDNHHRPCAYKEYLIICDDDSRLYILEKFNPDHVAPPAR